MVFPSDFLFGASTAAYQIEGAVNEDGRGPSIWDTFSHTPGKTWRGDTGDIACDHYHRYEEDLDLAARGNMSVYRFSTAWPRIMPEGKGVVNLRGLDFYDRLVDACLARGLDPWVCLYHWDLPQALQDEGGWTNRDIVGWYTDYAAIVAKRLKDRVRHFFAFNEPSMFVWLGYLSGRHAPGLTDPVGVYAASHHVNLATGDAIRRLRDVAPNARLGTILALNHYEPASDSPQDAAAAERALDHAHGMFLDPLYHGRYPASLAGRFEEHVRDGDLERCRARIDILGVNHYSRVRVVPPGDKRGMTVMGVTGLAPSGILTDMGWEEYPFGILAVLRRLRELYGNPEMVITENGAAYSDEVKPGQKLADLVRIDFLRGYLGRCAQAVAEGINLKGYLVWSLLDNYEWAYGYAKRFGLVHVDFETQVRTPKASYDWYAALARDKRIG
ncbi:MAG: beta-glucosidase [Alphaproteobacteria bacterium]|nr:beta-glucosidase [Alphaproteobacteria bacterium]